LSNTTASGVPTRIVHLGKFYPPDMGGIENVTESLAEGAVRAGSQVSVVCFDRAGGLAGSETRNGVLVLRAPASLAVASQPVGWAFLATAIARAHGADLVHIHVPNLLASLASIFIGPRPRVVIHWHSDIVGKGLLGRMVRPVEWAMLKRADRVICTSRAYAAASGALKPFRHKMRIVPIGVRDVAADCASDECKLPDRLAEKLATKRYVLAVGRLVPYKGFALLIEATLHLPPDVVTVIVGSGPLHNELSENIVQRGLGDRVLLTGHLPSDELKALLSRAELFCLPSIARSEAFGVVLLEAMSFGLPVVATEIEGSAVPWVNRHGVSGLNVPVGDPEALADACNRILCCSETRAKLSAGARLRYTLEFSERESVERVLAVYRELAAEK
jgi:glycosyltransferase involved in cell wall biosynthesis